MFLLDTNIISAMIREPDGAASRVAQRKPIAQIMTSVIVAGEMRYGYSRKSAPTLAAKVEAALKRLVVAPMEASVSQVYALLRANLKQGGNLIGAHDLWIAAHALSLNATLVTNNMREFSRVPGLRIEDWTVEAKR
jgi:tRNA(fMet)-specific endonuclease VapC